MASKGSKPGSEAVLKQLYSDLVTQQAAGDLEKVVKTCNRVLNVNHVDSKAFHVKIVALIKLSKFEMALQQLKERPQQRLRFEEAYALYRLNKSKDALDALDADEDEALTMRELELKAQVLYRLERFKEAQRVLTEVIRNTSDDFEAERRSNLKAIEVYVEDEALDEDEDDLDTYELVYNQACKLLALGKFKEAEKALKKSVVMCEEFLREEDDVEDADVEEETAILKAQLAYAVQMQQSGREKEAQGLYNAVLRAKPDDPGLAAVVANNLIAINKDQNIFDSKKRIKVATAEGVEHKLTFSARRTIARNHAVLAMTTNQVDLCRTLLKELKDKFNFDAGEADLIEAGVLSRAGKVKEAIEVILRGSGNKDLPLEKALIAASVQLERGNVKEALDVFDRVSPKERFRFGVLGSMVALHVALEDRVGAAKLLKDAVDYHGKAKTGGMDVVWRKTAEFHLKGDEPQVAASSLEQLLKSHPKDRRSVAQLVLAYAKFDLKRAMETSQRLPPFETGGEIDVGALETASFLGTKYAKRAAAAGATSPKRVATPKTPEHEEAAVPKKKRKKRVKRRLPKQFNPNVDPDPERWIPRRERTGFKKSRKDRRKGEKFTGAQGTAAGQADAFDYSKKGAAAAGAVPKSPQAAVQEPPVGPRQQHRKPGKAKGKKNKNRF